MTITGADLIAFINERGGREVGICTCGHWYEEHVDDICLPCSTSRGPAFYHHAFAFWDEATLENEDLWDFAQELSDAVDWTQTKEWIEAWKAKEVERSG